MARNNLTAEVLNSAIALIEKYNLEGRWVLDRPGDKWTDANKTSFGVTYSTTSLTPLRFYVVPLSALPVDHMLLEASSEVTDAGIFVTLEYDKGGKGEIAKHVVEIELDKVVCLDIRGTKRSCEPKRIAFVAEGDDWHERLDKELRKLKRITLGNLRQNQWDHIIDTIKL